MLAGGDVVEPELAVVRDGRYGLPAEEVEAQLAKRRDLPALHLERSGDALRALHVEHDLRPAAKRGTDDLLERAQFVLDRHIGPLDPEPVAIVRSEVGNEEVAPRIGAADLLVVQVASHAFHPGNLDERESAFDGAGREGIAADEHHAAGCLGERTVPVAGAMVLGLVLPVRSLGLDHGLGTRGTGVARDAIAEAAARRQGALYDQVAA